jgi:hypothetical protein
VSKSGVDTEELRRMAKEAESTIDYAFSEPMVAISQSDALSIADELDRLRAAIGRMAADR